MKLGPPADPRCPARSTPHTLAYLHRMLLELLRGSWGALRSRRTPWRARCISAGGGRFTAGSWVLASVDHLPWRRARVSTWSVYEVSFPSHPSGSLSKLAILSLWLLPSSSYSKAGGGPSRPSVLSLVCRDTGHVSGRQILLSARQILLSAAALKRSAGTFQAPWQQPPSGQTTPNPKLHVVT